MKWGQALVITLASGVAGAFATSALIKGISLEAFASILVAAGTLGLAYFTWQSVARTSDVIAGEDRRHQQGLAPLLTIEAKAGQRPIAGGAETGIRVCNIGYGLALNSVVILEGTLHYSATRMVEDTEENREQFKGKFPPDINSVIDGKNYLNVVEREWKPFERRISISALDSGGSYFQHEQEFLGRVSSGPVVLYRVATACYDDMFGNHYLTRYLDEELDCYEWQQPGHLRIPNPESR